MHIYLKQENFYKDYYTKYENPNNQSTDNNSNIDVSMSNQEADKVKNDKKIDNDSKIAGEMNTLFRHKSSSKKHNYTFNDLFKALQEGSVGYADDNFYYIFFDLINKDEKEYSTSPYAIMNEVFSELGINHTKIYYFLNYYQQTTPEYKNLSNKEKFHFQPFQTDKEEFDKISVNNKDFTKIIDSNAKKHNIKPQDYLEKLIAYKILNNEDKSIKPKQIAEQLRNNYSASYSKQFEMPEEFKGESKYIIKRYFREFDFTDVVKTLSGEVNNNKFYEAVKKCVEETQESEEKILNIVKVKAYRDIYDKKMSEIINNNNLDEAQKKEEILKMNIDVGDLIQAAYDGGKPQEEGKLDS